MIRLNRSHWPWLHEALGLVLLVGTIGVSHRVWGEQPAEKQQNDDLQSQVSQNQPLQPQTSAATNAPIEAIQQAVDKASKAIDQIHVPNLDELVARGVENHPDIIAAKAKLTLAEAELKSKQLEVSRQMVELQTNWREHLSAFENMKRGFERCQQEFDGASSQSEKQRFKKEMDSYVQAMALRQAELAEISKQIQVVTGGGLSVSALGSNMYSSVQQQTPQGPMADKIKAVLSAARTPDGKSSVILFTGQPLNEVLDYIKDVYGIQFFIQKDPLSELGIDPTTELITIQVHDVPLWGILQALEDTKQGQWEFVVRDYGIMLTSKQAAQSQGFVSAVAFGKVGETNKQNPTFAPSPVSGHAESAADNGNGKKEESHAKPPASAPPSVINDPFSK